MADISLRKRAHEGVDAESVELLKAHCVNADGSAELAPDFEILMIKMLAHSETFLSLLRTLEESPTAQPNRARIIDVGVDFQEQFRRKGKLSGLSWLEYLLREKPKILQKCLREDAHSNLLGGWHAVLTPEDPKNKMVMIGAKLPDYNRVEAHTQQKILKTLFPHNKDTYTGKRYSGGRMEAYTGLRIGRVHFFLAEDALEKFSAIGLHKTYNDPSVKPEDLIAFTMHARFLFVCSAKDIQDWLKTNEARFGFKDKMRIEGYLHPATQIDLDRITTDQREAIERAIGEKTELRRSGKIGTDRDMGDLYMRAVQKELSSTVLNWKNPLIASALEIAKRVDQLGL